MAGVSGAHGGTHEFGEEGHVLCFVVVFELGGGEGWFAPEEGDDLVGHGGEFLGGGLDSLRWDRKWESLFGVRKSGICSV